MKMYLMTGHAHDGSPEGFSCDWFVQAESAEEAYRLWEEHLKDEYCDMFNFSEVEGIQCFLVPTLRPAEGSRLLAWHSEVKAVDLAV